MRKLYLLLLMIAFTSGYAGAQVLNASLVPEVVKKSFAQKFPGASVNYWSQEDPGFVDAVFYEGKRKVVAMFIMSGDWVSTDTYLKEAEYPANAVNWMNTTYPDSKMSQLNKSETAKGIIYEANLKTQEGVYRLTFDTAGVLLTKNLQKPDK